MNWILLVELLAILASGLLLGFMWGESRRDR